MSDKRHRVFSDQEIRQLTLAYLYSRDGESASVEELHAFLNACADAVVVGESVKMAADGALLISWNQVTGSFAFRLSEKGLSEAKRNLGESQEATDGSN